jgi:hypothetical protein
MKSTPQPRKKSDSDLILRYDAKGSIKVPAPAKGNEFARFRFSLRRAQPNHIRASLESVFDKAA